MVVVFPRRLFVARAPVAEIEPLQNALGLEQLHRAIDGRERDAVVHLGRAPVQLHHVGVILGGIENSRDDPALARHAQAFVAAGALNGVRPARFRGCAVPKCQGLIYSLPRLISEGSEAGYRSKAMVSAAALVPSAF